MPVSVDDELDTDPELRVKLPRVATPKATLPQIGKQGYTVCHVPQFTDSYPARAEAPA